MLVHHQALHGSHPSDNTKHNSRHTSVQADVITLAGVRSVSRPQSVEGYDFSEGEHGAVTFMQDVTAGLQSLQRAKGLWHFTISPFEGVSCHCHPLPSCGAHRNSCNSLDRPAAAVCPSATMCGHGQLKQRKCSRC